jgi:eukaryotic-like serine/threonine-protein kinase
VKGVQRGSGYSLDNMRKAYALRARFSEREKFYIEAQYHRDVIGDHEKAQRVYELWALTYPRDWVPHFALGGTIYLLLGQYDKALAEDREALRLRPELIRTQLQVAHGYVSLNRFEEARVRAQELLAKNPEEPLLHAFLYRLAFLQNDTAGMAQQVSWSTGKPDERERWFLYQQVFTAAYFGRLAKARELSRQAVAYGQGCRTE